MESLGNDVELSDSLKEAYEWTIYQNCPPPPSCSAYTHFLREVKSKMATDDSWSLPFEKL